MWDANRSDPGASGMALPGPMRAPDSKMMPSLISRHFAIRIRAGVPEAFIL
jgi:hypothetical protein